jgi:hypothetical protein
MLSEQEINYITFYCSQRGVDFYDVQLELVDHLADMIENLRKVHPALSFKEALQMAGDQFSNDEFKKIVKSKRQQLKIKFKKLWQKEFISYFTIPKISITVLVIIAVVWFEQHGKIHKFSQMAIHLLNTSNALFFGFNSKIIKQIREDKLFEFLTFKVLHQYSFFMIIPAIFYLVLSLVDSITETAFFSLYIYQFAVYAFPLFLLVGLAWRKTYIGQYIFVKNQYPKAFAS